MNFPEPVIAVAIEPKTKADQEKLGVALAEADAGRPDVPRPHRRGDGPDDHLRHGRAAPRDHRRPPGARVQRRRQRRQAAGRLPRDDHARRPTARARYVRQTGGRGQYGHVKIRMRADDRGRISSSRTRSSAASIPKEFIKPIEQGIKEALERGVARRLPGAPASRSTSTTAATTTSTRPRSAFKIAGSMAFQDAAKKARSGPARADHGGRGRDARGVHGRRHRRPHVAARPHPGHGGARQRAGHHARRCRSREMFGYATDLRSHDAGARHLHDAVRAPTSRCRRTSAKKSSRRLQGTTR